MIGILLYIIIIGLVWLMTLVSAWDYDRAQEKSQQEYDRKFNSKGQL